MHLILDVRIHGSVQINSLTHEWFILLQGVCQQEISHQSAKHHVFSGFPHFSDLNARLNYGSEYIFNFTNSTCRKSGSQVCRSRSVKLLTGDWNLWRVICSLTLGLPEAWTDTFRMRMCVKKVDWLLLMYVYEVKVEGKKSRVCIFHVFSHCHPFVFLQVQGFNKQMCPGKLVDRRCLKRWAGFSVTEWQPGVGSPDLQAGELSPRTLANH